MSKIMQNPVVNFTLIMSLAITSVLFSAVDTVGSVLLDIFSIGLEDEYKEQDISGKVYIDARTGKEIVMVNDKNPPKKSGVHYAKMACDVLISAARVSQYGFQLMVRLDEEAKKINPESNLVDKLLEIRFDGDFAAFENKIAKIFDKETLGYVAYDYVNLFCLLSEGLTTWETSRIEEGQKGYINSVMDNPVINFFAQTPRGKINADDFIQLQYAQTTVSEELLRQYERAKRNPNQQQLAQHLEALIARIRSQEAIVYGMTEEKAIPADIAKKYREKVKASVAMNVFGEINLRDPDTMNFARQSMAEYEATRKINDEVIEAAIRRWRLNGDLAYEIAYCYRPSHVTVPATGATRYAHWLYIWRDKFKNRINFKVYADNEVMDILATHLELTRQFIVRMQRQFPVINNVTREGLFNAVTEVIFQEYSDAIVAEFAGSLAQARAGTAIPVGNIDYLEFPNINAFVKQKLPEKLRDNMQDKMIQADEFKQAFEKDMDKWAASRRIQAGSAGAIIAAHHGYGVVKVLLKMMPVKFIRYLFSDSSSLINECCDLVAGLVLGPEYISQEYLDEMNKEELVNKFMDMTQKTEDPFISKILEDYKVKEIPKYKTKKEEKEFNIFIEDEAFQKLREEEDKKMIEKKAKEQLQQHMAELARAQSKLEGGKKIPRTHRASRRGNVGKLQMKLRGGSALAKSFERFRRRKTVVEQVTNPEITFKLKTSDARARQYEVFTKEGPRIAGIAKGRNKKIFSFLNGLLVNRVHPNTLRKTIRDGLHKFLCSISRDSMLLNSQIVEIMNFTLIAMFLLHYVADISWSKYKEFVADRKKKGDKRGLSFTEFCKFLKPSSR